MCRIVMEKNLSKPELAQFLHGVDGYFHGTLSQNCKCASLENWADKLLNTAYMSKELVGCAIFYPNSEFDYVYLNILVVLREYGGRGIATKLIEQLKIYAHDN